MVFVKITVSPEFHCLIFFTRIKIYQLVYEFLMRQPECMKYHGLKRRRKILIHQTYSLLILGLGLCQVGLDSCFGLGSYNQVRSCIIPAVNSRLACYLSGPSPLLCKLQIFSTGSAGGNTGLCKRPSDPVCLPTAEQQCSLTS